MRSPAQPGAVRPFAIVTGAARGMGAATAIRLANDGFDLVLIDAPTGDLQDSIGYTLGTADELAQTAAACRTAGAQALGSVADVRDEVAIRRAAELVPAGRLRAAVAVAGIIGSDKLAWEFTRTELDTDLATNFHGVANLARVTIPMLLTAPPGTGRFIGVVSTAGASGLPRLAGYVASKHAALGYIRSLAADLGPLGVTANAVMPGSTRTSLLDRSAQVYGLSDVAQFEPHQRLGRLLDPSEIAAAVSWLCRPESSAITGASIPVDGGFVG